MSISINEILNLICSNDEDISIRGLHILSIISVDDPMLIITNLSQIRLAIFSLISISNPKYGAISSIIRDLSISFHQKPFLVQDYCISLINTSSDITLSYFRNSLSNDYNISPLLLPILDLFYRVLQSSFQLTPEIILSFFNHCLIGFLPLSSLVSAFLLRFEDIILHVSTFENQYFPLMAKLISNNDRFISYFFITLWVSLMPFLFDRESAIRSLSQQSQKLFLYIDEESPFLKQSKFLIDWIKSSNLEKENLKKNVEILKKEGLILLEKFSLENYNQNSENTISLSLKIQKEPIQRENIKVFNKGVFSNSWSNATLTMILDGQFLIWGDAAQQLQHGNALFFSDILSVELIDTEKKKLFNVINFKTKKENYQMAFD